MALTLAAQREYLALLEMRAKHESETKLFRYAPYPKQQAFHEAGALPGTKERLLIAGNQLGKCITSRTLVEHPDGTSTPAGDLYEAGVPFKVMAWDGEKAVEADAGEMIKNGTPIP